ncbi:MAG: hypothetical protein LC797_08780 [Chloroflexi bacterium]|nr:hypothetical protein [Chloroflexota bacterium]
MEQLDLMAAVRHNCGCTFARLDGALSHCSRHAMLARDQRDLGGLL